MGRMWMCICVWVSVSVSVPVSLSVYVPVHELYLCVGMGWGGRRHRGKNMPIHHATACSYVSGMQCTLSPLSSHSHTHTRTCTPSPIHRHQCEREGAGIREEVPAPCPQGRLRGRHLRGRRDADRTEGTDQVRQHTQRQAGEDHGRPGPTGRHVCMCARVFVGVGVDVCVGVFLHMCEYTGVSLCMSICPCERFYGCVGYAFVCERLGVYVCMPADW